MKMIGIVGVLLALVGLMIASVVNAVTTNHVASEMIAIETRAEEMRTGIGGYRGMFTTDLPIFDEIEGYGPISDEIARYAMGVAVRFRLAPSLVLAQWAYESGWGRSHSASTDNNPFGITWFPGAPFPPGTARGIGGSEGGHYMAFPSMQSAFAYYGFMIATQSNFRGAVGLRDPMEALVVLLRGGYAASAFGLYQYSSYFRSVNSIITANGWRERFDPFAFEKWDRFNLNLVNFIPDGSRVNQHSGNIRYLKAQVGNRLGNGQCFALPAYFVSRVGGPGLGAGVTAITSAIGDTLPAWNIGSAYDWGRYGWAVMYNPTFEDLQVGDIINWFPSEPNFPSIFGHTGVIESISENGHFRVFEMNTAEFGERVGILNRHMDSGRISSIVRKVGQGQ